MYIFSSRLTADGNLKVCLFGNTEVNLLEAMRSEKEDDSNLVSVISAAVKRKKARQKESNRDQG